MSDFSENFYIIGHRGAAGERFENSLEGIEHALSLQVDAIEIDIREHSSELWVIHDHDLKRLTGNAGLFERQADVSNIRLRNGEAVPSLKQVLDLTWGRIPLNIEIKAVENLQLLLALLDTYPDPGPVDDLPHILISSFDHRALLELRQSGCRWPLAPISSGIPLLIDAELEQLAPWSWHFDNEYLDFTLVERLRNLAIPSLVFTVNDAVRARELRLRGVSGIFTDYPTKMLQIV